MRAAKRKLRRAPRRPGLPACSVSQFLLPSHKDQIFGTYRLSIANLSGSEIRLGCLCTPQSLAATAQQTWSSRPFHVSFILADRGWHFRDGHLRLLPRRQLLEGLSSCFADGGNVILKEFSQRPDRLLGPQFSQCLGGVDAFCRDRVGE